MRREFLGIYQQLYTDYQRAETRPLQFPGLPGPPRQLVAEAMEQARNEIKPRVVRPDAMLFLLVNANELVVKPLLHPEAPIPKVRPSAQAISDMIRDDTRTILKAAASGTARDGQLSAVDVMQAAASVYNNLNVRAFDLWG